MGIVFEKYDTNESESSYTIPCGFDKQGFHRLHRFARDGDIESAKAELAKGVDVDIRTWNNVHEPQFGRGLQDLMQTKNTTPLIFAASYARVDMVKLLVANKADVNSATEYGITALQCACDARNIQMVSFLLQHKAHIETPETRGQHGFKSALTRAIMGTVSFPIVQLLMDSRADLFSQNNLGRTPIDNARRIWDGLDNLFCVERFQKASKFEASC